MSKRAIIALGSNTKDAEAYLDRAIEEISRNEDIKLAQSTRKVWTEPIESKGITSESPQFLNSLIAIETILDYNELNNKMKEVECLLGSSKTDKQQGNVAIDIDILSYDKERHHLEDWNRQYIQALIQEL